MMRGRTYATIDQAEADTRDAVQYAFKYPEYWGDLDSDWGPDWVTVPVRDDTSVCLPERTKKGEH